MSTFLTDTGTGSKSGNAEPGMNPHINFNYLPLEIQDDLQLLPETDVTDTTSFRTGGNDLYLTTVSGDINDHRRRRRTYRPGAASKPPQMSHDEFIGLFLGEQNHQTVEQLFDILRFGVVSRPKEENVGSDTAR